MKPKDEIKKAVFAELAETDNEKEIAEKYGLTVDEVTEIMEEYGYEACPNCGRYVESGEMYHNPEDESDYACDACAMNWGWE